MDRLRGDAHRAGGDAADGLEVGYVFLVTVYLALGAGVVWLLRRLAQRPPATEVGTPVAPAGEAH